MFAKSQRNSSKERLRLGLVNYYMIISILFWPMTCFSQKQITYHVVQSIIELGTDNSIRNLISSRQWIQNKIHSWWFIQFNSSCWFLRKAMNFHCKPKHISGRDKYSSYGAELLCCFLLSSEHKALIRTAGQNSPLRSRWDCILSFIIYFFGAFSQTRCFTYYCLSWVFYFLFFFFSINE